MRNYRTWVFLRKYCYTLFSRKLDDCQSEYNSYTVHPKGSLHDAQSHDPTVKCHRDRINPPDACTYWKAKLKKEVNLCTQKRHYFCVQVYCLLFDDFVCHPNRENQTNNDTKNLRSSSFFFDFHGFIWS